MSPWTPPILRTPPAEVVITPQQANVLSGMCCGHAYKQIAARLGISPHTVKTHTKALYKALGARDRGHAVALAVTGQVRITVGTRAAPEWEMS